MSGTNGAMTGLGTPAPSARFVRQFALTAGRARSLGRDLPLESIVVTSDVWRDRTHAMRDERRAIAEICQRPLAMAEVSARLELHLGIVRVLVSDLCDAGVIEVASTATPAGGPDLATLERLLDDLHSL
jgi:hypothetical protein